MKESENNSKNLANILKNGDDNLINEAIESLRHEEPFSGAIRMLSEFYDDTPNREIRQNIENFFNDIKNNYLKKEIVEVLRLPLQPATVKMVASSCWQSGMDYSDYLEEFSELFVKSDYETALEYMTVIEEMSVKTDAEQRKRLIVIIKKAENMDIGPLAKELIDTLHD